MLLRLTPVERFVVLLLRTRRRLTDWFCRVIHRPRKERKPLPRSLLWFGGSRYYTEVPIYALLTHLMAAQLAFVIWFWK